MGKFTEIGFKGLHCYSQVFAVFLLLGSLGAIGCATTETPPPKSYTDTEKARMIIEIANGALAEGDATGALQNLYRAEQLDEQLPELHHSRALAFYVKNDLKSAIQAAKRSVELKPNYADANNTLGKLLMDAGRDDEAEKPLQVAANDALYREAFKAMTNLGILSYRQNKLEPAQKYLDRAILEAPAAACVAYYYRGHIDLKKNNLKDAVSNYSKATKKGCAQFGEAYLALGLAYQQDRQYPLARRTFLDIQKRYPNTKLAERAIEQLRFLP